MTRTSTSRKRGKLEKIIRRRKGQGAKNKARLRCQNSPSDVKLDNLCRSLMFQRDGHRCRRCGSGTGKIQWHHIYSRRYKHLKWDLRNVITLCGGCHLWIHSVRAAKAEEWLKNNMPIETLESLDADFSVFYEDRETGARVIRRVDKDEVLATLEAWQELIDTGTDPGTLPGCKLPR